MADRREITITVNRRPGGKTPARGHRPRKAPLKGPAPGAYLPRRLQKGKIEFWDLGLIKNDLGDFVDLPFSAGPSLTDHGGTYSNVDFTEADYLALRDLILAVPASQLESKFKKLSYEGAERYGLGIFSGANFYPIARDGASYAGASTTPVSGTHWKQNGLVVPNPLTNFFIDSYGAFTLWGTGDGFTKWTTTPSYAAADVGEQPIALVSKLFLMPRIVNPYILSIAGGNTDSLVSPYKAMQRSVWLPLNWPDTGYPIFSYPTDLGADPAIANADKVTIANELKVGAQEWDNLGGVHGDTSAFPMYEDLIIGVVETLAQDPSAHYHPGTLLAIVKQNGHTYYVWWDEAESGYSQERTITFTGAL